MSKYTMIGSGAAQGYPSVWSLKERIPFCDYRLNPNLRFRATFRIGEHTQIDCGPDNHFLMTYNGLSMLSVKDLFITHTHEDHLCPGEIFAAKLMGVENYPELYKSEHKTNLYLSEPALEWLVNKWMPIHHKPSDLKKIEDLFELIALKPFATYACMHGKVTPILGHHKAHGVNEWSFNYLFEDEKQYVFLYATDTGYWDEQTWDFLKTQKIDAMVLEATFGNDMNRGNVGDGHTNFATVIQMVERLQQMASITTATPIYLTHINPDQTWTHADFEKACQASAFNLIIGYDGLSWES